MNKTLLLILCDFLLLNLLALTQWERAEPSTPGARPAGPEVAAAGDARTAEQDMVELMQMSLEEERQAREQLAQQLGATQMTLEERQQAMDALRAERERLASNLQQTQQSAEQLQQQFESARRDASMSQERLAQLQRDLEQREAEASRRAEQLAQLEQQQTQARERIEQLNVAVRVAEQEKIILRETADTYRQQAEVERTERQRVQETTTQLAQGVGQLAEKSGAIAQEIRENRPINANTLFSEFLANRVTVNIRAERPALLGPIDRNVSPRTLLVTDGQDTFALIHVEDSPFNFRQPASNWTQISATLQRDNQRTQIRALHFLAQDPRLIALPVDAQQVALLGAKVYQTALEPFKFAEAVLIANGGQGYGEVPFKVDPASPAYVRMDNRLVRRLFGDFSPSRGDLVLSKTGELLGVMVSSDVCALVTNFLPQRTLPTGDTSAVGTAELLNSLAARARRLP